MGAAKTEDRRPSREGSAAIPVWFAVAVLVALAALHYATIGANALADPDEPRYAEIGREMLQRGDWITPTLNYVKYFEKPPLVYWLTTASLATFGVDEFAARLPVVLCGFVTLAITFALAARMYGRSTAILATVILGTSSFPAMLQQVLTLDTPLATCMAAALAAVWFGHESSGRGWYRVAYVATALGVLVKGPVSAVLVGGIAAVFLLAAGGWPALRRAVDGIGIAVAAVIVLPWFVLVSWRNPEFVNFFIVDQHIKRYLWTTEHGQPIWFFAVLMPVVLAPWSLLTFTDPALWARHLKPREWSVATRYLLLWLLSILVFFSLSKSKLLTYILPALPPFAILLGRLVDRALEERDDTFLARGSVLVLVLGAGTFVSGAILGFFITHWRFPLVRPYLFVGGALLALAGWAARRLLQSRGPRACIAVLTIGFVGLLAVAINGRVLSNSYRELSRAAAKVLQPGDRLVSYISYFQGLVFYTGHRVTMASGVGELDFGRQQGDQSDYFWPDDAKLRQEWSGPGRVYLAIRATDLEKMDPPLDPPPIQLATESRVVLVTNRPPGGQ